MKKNHRFASVFFFLFLCFLSGQADAQTKYCIKDLGYLKDNNDSLLGCSINNQGQVVGRVSFQSYGVDAFVWQDSNGMQYLQGKLFDYVLYDAHSINDWGHIVGSAWNPSNWGYWRHVGYIWQEGVGMTDLGSLSNGDTIAYDINNAGHVVGSSVYGSACHGFIWQDGIMTDLGNIGISNRYMSRAAFAINNLGQAVGVSQFRKADGSRSTREHACLWENGATEAIDLTPEAGDDVNTSACDINDAGLIVGTKLDQNIWKRILHLWQGGPGGTSLDVAVLDVLTKSPAINNHNQIVGNYYGGLPFLYEDGTFYDLYDHIAGGDEWTYFSVSDINDDGQITGTGCFTSSSHRQHAMVLTPVDEDHQISGQVLDTRGNPVADVTISVPGCADVTTNAHGNYLISVCNDGTYQVVPSKAGYTFDPPLLLVTVPPLLGGQDFIAIAEQQPHTISGTILDVNDVPMADILVMCDCGENAVTDANGEYILTVEKNSTCILTPTSEGYTFEPASRTIEVQEDIAGQDFTAHVEPQTFTISGHVLEENGTAVADVTVSAHTGESAVTDAAGYYILTITGVGTHTLTPKKQGYRFDPAQHFILVESDVSGQDFTAMVNLPPAKVSLEVEPRPEADSYGLRWLAPGADGDNGGPAAEYDIRFSNQPIEDDNWDSAQQVTGEPVPDEPGSKQSVLVYLATNETWYFAIKTADEEGNWSALSDWVAILDSGFRESDSYVFRNYSDCDFTLQHLIALFGHDTVCRGEHLPCTPYLNMEKMVAEVNQLNMGIGHCAGIATTELLFFSGWKQPSDFNALANVSRDLSKEDVFDHIAYYHGSNWFRPVRRPNRVRFMNTGLYLDQLISDLSSGIASSVYSGLCIDNTYKSCHAFVPAVVQWSKAKDEYTIFVSDSNYPNDFGLKFEVNPILDRWCYHQYPDGSWEHENTSQPTLEVIPISIYKAPDDGVLDNAYLKSRIRYMLCGLSNMVLVDNQGRRLGIIHDELIEEIPDAFASSLYADLEIPIEPIYDLPLGSFYTAILNGENLTEPDPAKVTRFGPMCAAWVDGIIVDQTTSDRIEVSPDGRQIAFTPSSDQEVTLGLVFDNEAKSYSFEIKNCDVDPGNSVTFFADEDAGRLVLSHAQGQAGYYDLAIRRVTAQDEQVFVYPGVPMTAGEHHHIYFGQWDGVGAMQMGIDRDNDGTDDALRPLANGGSTVTDQDGDTYEGIKSGGNDCDDTNAFIFPGAGEVCGDAIDNNCNGKVDENCPVQTIFDLQARAKSGKVQLTWTAVEVADCYNVYRSETSGGPYTKIADCHVTDYCTYLDTDVVNGTTYYYVVRSLAQGIESLDSNEASATPQSRR